MHTTRNQHFIRKCRFCTAFMSYKEPNRFNTQCNLVVAAPKQGHKPERVCKHNSKLNFL